MSTMPVFDNQKQNMLGEPFPNPFDPNVDPPTHDEAMDDLRRQQREIDGTEPFPYQTFPFWASFFANCLAMLLVSGVIAPDHPIQQISWAVIIPLLAHFGYDRTVVFLRNRRAEIANGSAPYRRPLFWGSVLAMFCSSLLGSGLPVDSFALQITGWLVIILPYAGINVQTWIRRRDMVDPFEDPEGALLRLLRLLIGVKKGIPRNGAQKL